MLKFICDQCELILVTNIEMVNKAGWPICPNCNVEMQVEASEEAKELFVIRSIRVNE